MITRTTFGVISEPQHQKRGDCNRRDRLRDDKQRIGHFINDVKAIHHHRDHKGQHNTDHKAEQRFDQ